LFNRFKTTIEKDQFPESPEQDLQCPMLTDYTST